MSNEQRRYYAYLLRLWQVRHTGQWVWRASLEDAQSNERVGFGSLGELCRYLQRQGEASFDDANSVGPDEDSNAV